jgi:aspartate/tyrosine/aromatic aminotransferase
MVIRRWLYTEVGTQSCLNRSGRICIAGRNQSKVERAAEAMVAVMR